MIGSINLVVMNTRDDARKLVDDGLVKLRDGLLSYHELGLCTQDLYDDLVSAGWDIKKRTLQRLRTALEGEGCYREATDVNRRLRNKVIFGI